MAEIAERFSGFPERDGGGLGLAFLSRGITTFNTNLMAKSGCFGAGLG